MRLRMTLWFWLLLGPVLLPGLAGCKGRKTNKTRARDGCSASSLQETRRWLADLCAAHEQKFVSPNHHWWGLPLARADVKLVKRLPRGVLVTLTPSRLFINGKPAPDWPKPPTWKPADMSRGTAPVITRLLPVLRRTLGASAALSTAKAALADLERRGARGVAPVGRPQPGAKPPPRPKDLPSGLTVLTLITAKNQLAGRGPRLVHLAIAPRVSALQVVQLQSLLALAGFDGLNLLFTPRTAPDPPAPPLPRVYEALGTIGPGSHARVLRAARQRALRLEEQRWEEQGCSAMTRLRSTLAKSPVAGRCRMLQDRLPDTIRRCKCPVDERPLLSLWLAVLAPMDHVGIKTARLHPRGRIMRARADAIWSEIADGIAARKGQHLWIGIEN